MSASSRPTRKPRSRKPSARFSAVVDFPTPPLPDATAITAETPGISDCFDIGEDLGSPVSVDYFDQKPYAFNGTIYKTDVKYTGADEDPVSASSGE